MKILGTKFFGQDSAVFYIDTDKKQLFAINSDRVSRIKKDNYDISPALDQYTKHYFQNIDELSYSFANYDGNDAVLETKGTSYYWLNYQRLLRKITKPRYRSDLNQKYNLAQKLLIYSCFILIPKIFYYQFVRDYYWKKHINNDLPGDFHFRMIDRYIRETLSRYEIEPKKIKYHDHHTCHAFSAYYSSEFAYTEKSVVFTLDEHGDECFSKLFVFDKNKFKEYRKSKVKTFWQDGRVHVTSIADVYSNFTEAVGLIRSTDEGKVEALAAYGQIDKELLNDLMEMISIVDLRFEFDLDKYKKLSRIKTLIEIKERIGEKNFCATVQHWLEELSVEYLNQAHESLKIDNLCLAGGVTANVIMNHKIYENTPFKKLHIVPAMGDEGSAMGAAIISAIENGEDLSWLKDSIMPYYGPSYDEDSIKNAISQFPNKIKSEKLGDQWHITAAESICNNLVIGIFHGRMEFGPRALGNRSILANAQNPEIRDRINSLIKRRAYYQPFCPSVLENERERLFDNSYKHKHMATAFLMKKEYQKQLPSAVHVDGTSRPQFVESSDNPEYYKLLEEVKSISGFGVIINTSFNLHGRPVVNTPIDAIVDFLDCNMDELYLEGYKITRAV